MDAIHINWTKPFRNRFNAPYEVEDFEILTTILSALKWREKNGNIKMVTDSIGAQYYKKTGLDVIWNSVENILDNVDVNSNVFCLEGERKRDMLSGLFYLRKRNRSYGIATRSLHLSRIPYRIPRELKAFCNEPRVLLPL